jgi:transposase
VRKALRNALTNCKKTYQSVLELSFPELGSLLEVDGVGIRELLERAPTPAAIARVRLSTLEKNWMLRSKAARLKALAADSIADPDLSAASAPALQAILEALSAMEARLRSLDQQIEILASQSVDPQTKALVESMPGFGPTTAVKVLAYLPREVLHSGPNRKVAARLQAFMGNDPRLKESGQWKGQTKMSKLATGRVRPSADVAWKPCAPPSSKRPSAPHNMTPNSKLFIGANGPKAKLTTSL